MTATGQNESRAVPQVFISYYAKDASYAQRLYSDMRAANLNPWIDKENLLPGQNIKNETMKAIKKATFSWRCCLRFLFM